MERRTALYARVSSEAQAPDNTIASQLASLRERLAADGFLLEPDACISARVTGARFFFVRLWNDLPTRRRAVASQVAMSMLPTGPLVVARLKTSRDGAPRRPYCVGCEEGSVTLARASDRADRLVGWLCPAMTCVGQSRRRPPDVTSW
jgi:hypothetical protein